MLLEHLNDFISVFHPMLMMYLVNENIPDYQDRVSEILAQRNYTTSQIGLICHYLKRLCEGR